VEGLQKPQGNVLGLLEIVCISVKCEISRSQKRWILEKQQTVFISS